MEEMNAPAKTHICVITYAEDLSPEALLPLCTPLRRRKLSRLARTHGWESDAVRQSLAAELAFLACRSLADRAGERFPAEYSCAPGGRPVIEGGFMSLAHTPGAACAALSTAPVGIDIERRRSFSPRAVRRLLNDEERAEYAAAEDGEAFLLHAWTAKESAAKLTGEGLSGLGRIALSGRDAVITAEGVRNKLFCAEVCLASPGERARLAAAMQETALPLMTVLPSSAAAELIR